MASPVIMTMFTRSDPTSLQTSSGSNRATSTTLLATKLCPITPHCVAPCMRGATGKNVICPPAARAFSAERVDPSAQCEEDVLVAPDDALWHSGRAPGVEDVLVVT